MWDKTSLPTALNPVEASDVAAGDVNGDAMADLAVLRYDEVLVFPGSAAGLRVSGVKRFNEDTPGVKGHQVEVDEIFGCGGIRILNHGKGRQGDLSAGSPLDDSGNGTVNVLYGSASGTTSKGDQLWHQDVHSVPGKAESEDGFGGRPCYVDEG